MPRFSTKARLRHAPMERWIACPSLLFHALASRLVAAGGQSNSGALTDYVEAAWVEFGGLRTAKAAYVLLFPLASDRLTELPLLGVK
jgi:hypothetical protein